MVGTKGKARETSKSARFAAALALACATIPCACRTPENAQYAPAKGVGAFEPEQPNPLFVETTDPYALWDAVVDVIDNYYVIESEIPVRVYERQDTDGRSYQYRTEGRLETEPSIVGGVLEPWRKNGHECGSRWEATFQTMRTSAVVRVVPEGEGFFVYLSVFQEIEDLPRPLGSTVGYHQQFNDDVSQLTQPVGEYAQSRGWIPRGRDEELERTIMRELAWRVGAPRAVLHAGVDSNLTP